MVFRDITALLEPLILLLMGNDLGGHSGRWQSVPGVDVFFEKPHTCFAFFIRSPLLLC